MASHMQEINAQIEAEGKSIKKLVDKTIANMKVFLDAGIRRRNHNMFTSDVQKQQDYVESSHDRCIRCGDLCPTIMPAPPLSLICDECQTELMERDKPEWFIQMLRTIAEGPKDGKKN